MLKARSGFVGLDFYIASGMAFAMPVIFSDSTTVTTVDRMATFDGLAAGVNVQLENYSEDSLYVTANGYSYMVGFGAFNPGDSRNSGFHYDDGGNYEYVSIRATDGMAFSAVDFLLGDGQPGLTHTNFRWRTFRNGVMTGNGREKDIEKGHVVGLATEGGFDELQIAAIGDGLHPGWGNLNGIAIDDVRVTLTSAMPIPAAVWLFGSALAGLGWMRRKQTV